MQPGDATSPQLSEENLRQLAAARVGQRKINRAVSIARFDGWTLGFFGGFTLLLGFTDISCILIGSALCVIAFVELKGANKLSKLDPASLRMLMYNQLVLAGLLLIYSVWSLHAGLSGGQLGDLNVDDPQVAQALAPYAGLGGAINVILYGGLILVAIFGQGGLAFYYFTRQRALRNYVETTPKWILDMQAAGIKL
jgi:hypothetical protein